MFENSEQCTANNVLVLHVLKCIGEPVNDYHFTEIMMGPGLVNYFTIEQCLAQMIDAGYVSRSLDSRGVALYSLTAEGMSMLDSMKYMLSGGLGARYESFVKLHSDEIKKSMHIDAHYSSDAKGNLFVHCFVRDGLMCIVDLTLPVACREDAERICESWRDDSSKMFIKLTKALYEGADIE